MLHLIALWKNFFFITFLQSSHRAYKPIFSFPKIIRYLFIVFPYCCSHKPHCNRMQKIWLWSNIYQDNREKWLCSLTNLDKETPKAPVERWKLQTVDQVESGEFVYKLWFCFISRIEVVILTPHLITWHLFRVELQFRDTSEKSMHFDTGLRKIKKSWESKSALQSGYLIIIEYVENAAITFIRCTYIYAIVVFASIYS